MPRATTAIVTPRSSRRLKNRCLVLIVCSDVQLTLKEFSPEGAKIGDPLPVLKPTGIVPATQCHTVVSAGVAGIVAVNVGPVPVTVACWTPPKPGSKETLSAPHPVPVVVIVSTSLLLSFPALPFPGFSDPAVGLYVTLKIVHGTGAGTTRKLSCPGGTARGALLLAANVRVTVPTFHDHDPLVVPGRVAVYGLDPALAVAVCVDPSPGLKATFIFWHAESAFVVIVIDSSELRFPLPVGSKAGDGE